MVRFGVCRRAMVVAACTGGVGLAAPAGAPALTTHSATDHTLDTHGALKATAKCGAGEHVVSGGYKTSDASRSGSAVVSRAVNSNRWTVQFFPLSMTSERLTTYAYCASGGGAIATHQNTVPTATTPTNTDVTAACGSNQAVVSGGYALMPSRSGYNSPIYSAYALSATQWRVTGAFPAPSTLTAFAYCQRGVVVKVRSRTRTNLSLGTGSATAKCHKGETLLSGGYKTTPQPDYNNNAGPDSFYSASYRSGTRSWTASAANYSFASGQITAFAYCIH